jgi:UDP-N-acetyl-D-mannosaminouronate:lipid I N-acetyl-D-mannosaminouronosyltransferase
METNSRYLNGVRTYAFKSHDALLDYIEGKKNILIAINVEKILNSGNDLKEIINENIGYPDGIGAVWALKMKGIKKAVRIPGCEFWLDIVKKYYKTSSFYLIGSKEEVIQETIARLKREFPKIKIVGYRNGYLKEGDTEILKKDIQVKKPDFVFVAMGSPKQELLMNEFLKVHPAIYQGLVGSFDIYSGRLTRAPKIILKVGLEGYYRLLIDPKRIGREKVAFIFLYKLITGKI